MSSDGRLLARSYASNRLKWEIHNGLVYFYGSDVSGVAFPKLSGKTLKVKVNTLDYSKEFTRFKLNQNLADTKWSAQYIKGIEIGKKERINVSKTYLSFINESDFTVFSGINHFNGNYETKAKIDLKFQNLKRALKNHINENYDNNFLFQLKSVDTYLVVGKSLYLYKGTELIATFKRV